MNRLGRIAQLLEAGTPRPWRLAKSGHLGWAYNDSIVGANGGEVVGPQDEQGGEAWNSDDDAALIVEAVNFAQEAVAAKKRTVVTLCGSTRFSEAYRDANLRETLAGKIVLSIGCDLRADNELWADPAEAERYKRELDLLHLDKIAISDEILVLNVGGYVGSSTSKEIQHARALDIPVRYLEDVQPPVDALDAEPYDGPFEEDYSEPPYCEHCGKDLEDFSRLGCRFCDVRNPNYGVL